MSNKYNITYIGDISNINANSYSNSENWEYVNYLDTGNITKNKIDEIQYIDLSVDKLPSRAKRKVIKNSILYSTVRPNQQHFGFIYKQPENFLVSTGFAVIDVKPDIANPKFVYYYLTQDKITDGLHALAEQSVSAYPSIKPSDIGNVKIFLPDLPTQEKIVRILSSLDDKIELNNKINQNLEQQAQAIFNKFFENCQIENKVIGNYLTPKRGKNLLSKDAKHGDIPVIAGGLNPATYHNIANTMAPVITISASGANAGYVNLWHIPVWASDSSYIDSSINPYVYFWYVLLKKRQKEIYDSQTGSAQPHIYPKHIEKMSIFNLNIINVKKYNEHVKPLFETIGNNLSENKRLTQLRDTLLPKLMSGEIDVDKI